MRRALIALVVMTAGCYYAALRNEGVVRSASAGGVTDASYRAQLDGKSGPWGGLVFLLRGQSSHPDSAILRLIGPRLKPECTDVRLFADGESLEVGATLGEWQEAGGMKNAQLTTAIPGSAVARMATAERVSGWACEAEFTLRGSQLANLKEFAGKIGAAPPVEFEEPGTIPAPVIVPAPDGSPESAPSGAPSR
jgi:hypothetical protein